MVTLNKSGSLILVAIMSFALILLALSGCTNPSPVCGNNVCDNDENITSCPSDCGNAELVAPPSEEFVRLALSAKIGNGSGLTIPCGDDAVYNPKTQTCCVSVEYHGTVGNSLNMGCCGLKIESIPFDRNAQTCCVGEDFIGTVGSPKGQQCCGTKGAEPYDANAQSCCVNKLGYPIIGDSKGLSCCGILATPYDANALKCCVDNIGVGVLGTPATATCCGGSNVDASNILFINASTNRCCAGQYNILPVAPPILGGCCTNADCRGNIDTTNPNPVCGVGEVIGYRCESNACRSYCIPN